MDGYLLTGSLQKKFIVKVRSFSSATTECMWDYCKPTLRKDDPSNIILHTGTCDFKLEKEPEEIAEDIVKLAKSMKKKDNKITISKIIPRGDEFNDKVNDVNKKLEQLCIESNIDIISHNNINNKRHLRRGKVHLNNTGTSILARNYKDYLLNCD